MEGAEVGTHAEVVRTTLGRKVRMHHFSYMGDATVGDGVNIGAGAISANYDGKSKHPTRIGRNAFIGSGSVLVAPAVVGEGALVGAGTVVPPGRRVRPHTVVVGVPAHELKRRKNGK
jgi:bifunctional UDP-N-acetylglucosamine pyrophosphorylase/glucosamine-1-phosphate N-acetyltransferase